MSYALTLCHPDYLEPGEPLDQNQLAELARAKKEAEWAARQPADLSDDEFIRRLEKRFDAPKKVYTAPLWFQELRVGEVVTVYTKLEVLGVGQIIDRTPKRVTVAVNDELIVCGPKGTERRGEFVRVRPIQRKCDPC